MKAASDDPGEGVPDESTGRSDLPFAKRTVLVTGAASGIGAATARLFSARGATVYCADIDESGCRAVAEQLHGQSASTYTCRLDVTDEDAWETALDRIRATSGTLDVLVNSAGISHSASLTDMALTDWRRVFAVNVDGVFLGTRHAIRLMRATGSGCVVNVSSASGIRASAGAVAYSSSKAAVGMLTRAAAKECREEGLAIRINAVAPAGVRTPLWRTMPFFQDLVTQHGSEQAAFRVLAASSPSRRFAEPVEVAEAILYLASDKASMINGIELPIDDGYLL